MKNLFTRLLQGKVLTAAIVCLTLAFVACSDGDSDFATRPSDGSSNVKSGESDGKGSSGPVALATPCKTETEDNCEYGELVDDRDSQTYKTVKIGDQVWMAENLNYKGGDSYCYNDSAEYCEEYGRLYTWVSARDACPTGWHLPTREDLDTLLSTVGGASLAGNALKSFAGWNRAEDEGNGVDSYGFSGSPAGWMDLTGDYYQVGYFGRFWSISSCSDKKAYTLHLKYNAESGSLDCTLKESAISVRCVKD